MTIKAITSELDQVFKPLGFERQKNTWNRKSGSFVDVVDIQTSKSKDKVTVNAGVVHSDVYATVWGDIPTFVEEPFCTVRARIGDLIDGRDLWWDVSDSDVAAKIAGEVSNHVPPFFERMHSADAMERFLMGAQVVKGKYPPPIIYLAILKHELGDAEAACSLLNDLNKKTVGAWREKVSQISERLSCS